MPSDKLSHNTCRDGDNDLSEYCSVLMNHWKAGVMKKPTRKAMNGREACKYRMKTWMCR